MRKKSKYDIYKGNYIMEKQTINDLSLLNATNIDNVQLSNMTINTKFVDSAQMKTALDKIDNNSKLLSTILS